MKVKPLLWQLEDICKPQYLKRWRGKAEKSVIKAEGGKYNTPSYLITEPMERKGYLGKDVQRGIKRIEARQGRR